MWGMMQATYGRVRRGVKMKHGMTGKFEVEVGVAQGAVLYPYYTRFYLFAL